jgi:hypothetical protein
MQQKVITLALLGVFALIAGLVSGALAALMREHPVRCVAVGAGTFATTMFLGIAVWTVVQ